MRVELVEDGPGLRDRKKAKCREDILEQARQLFASQGVDATTIADIARAVDVSPPTVFNYFGNKDGILIALITEGVAQARQQSNALNPRTDIDFGTFLVTVFTEFSEGTLRIASKRIWRYSEAAAIRHPTTELSQSYRVVNMDVVKVLKQILSAYNLTLRDGGAPDVEHLAQVLFDLWNAAFFDLIKVPEMTIAEHRAALERRIVPLCRMIFAPEFFASPTLRQRSDPPS